MDLKLRQALVQRTEFEGGEELADLLLIPSFEANRCRVDIQRHIVEQAPELFIDPHLMRALRDAVKERAHQVRINKELGRLLDDVPLDIDPATIRLEAWNEEEVRKLFTSLEFRTLHERLTELKIHAAAAPPALELESILELASAKDLRDGVAVALAWSSDWLALCDGPGEARMLPLAAAMQRLAGFLKDAKRQKIAHDAKALFRSALSAGVEIQGLHCDTKIAAYLLEPGSAPGYTVRDTVGRYLR